MEEEIGFEKLVEFYRSVLKHFPDKRVGKNCSYSVADAALGAFSVFFMQSPSFLAHQRTMEATEHKNNAASLFKVNKIPSDNHMRDLLDDVAPEAVFPVFNHILSALQITGQLETFRFLDRQLLVALDGVEYFNSNNIHCSRCSTKEHKNGEISYSHSAITPVIVHPNHRRVISLPPEFITPQDGHEKQDCESAAAKRWITHTGAKYAELGVTILGDDLYSRQPLCKTLLEQNFHFILVCKHDSHKTLYKDFIDSGIKLETMEIKRRNCRGKNDKMKFRFINGVPLRDGKDALMVNWCEVVIVNGVGKVTYCNSFISDHFITVHNVKDIVLAGRTRWKIENENNNTLKTKGYHLEHNFGHGKKHLAALLLTLNMLAFLFHTVLEFTDKRYRILRAHFSRRMTFFEHARSLTVYFFFSSWQDMMAFMIKGQELEMKLDSS
jgi:hypothetical protein